MIDRIIILILFMVIVIPEFLLSPIDKSPMVAMRLINKLGVLSDSNPNKYQVSIVFVSLLH